MNWGRRICNEELHCKVPLFNFLQGAPSINKLSDMYIHIYILEVLNPNIDLLSCRLWICTWIIPFVVVFLWLIKVIIEFKTFSYRQTQIFPTLHTMLGPNHQLVLQFDDHFQTSPHNVLVYNYMSCKSSKCIFW